MNRDQRGFNVVRGLLTILIIAALSVGSWYAWNHRPGQNGDKSKNTAGSITAPDGWKAFSDDKNKVGFIYPKSWGEAHLAVNKGETGQYYAVSFTPDPASKSKRSVAITFDTDDATKKVCDAGNTKQCTTIKGFTKNDISETLAKYKSKLVKSDNNSYITLRTVPASNISSTMSLYQAVELQAIKVSAVSGTYNIAGNTTCPTDKLSTAPNDNCVTESDYDNLSKTIKSLRVI